MDSIKINLTQYDACWKMAKDNFKWSYTTTHNETYNFWLEAYPTHISLMMFRDGIKTVLKVIKVNDLLSICAKNMLKLGWEEWMVNKNSTQYANR